MISSLVNTFLGLEANKKNNSNSFLGNLILLLSIFTKYSFLSITILSNSILVFSFTLECILLTTDRIFLNKILGLTGFDI